MFIKAAMQGSKDRLELRELELREPGYGEILVKIAACGICHTDLSMLTGGMVMGHEASGIIERIGTGVSDLAVGDPVVLSYPSCGECGPCKEQKPYDCIHFDTLFSGERLTGKTTLSDHGNDIRAFFGQGGFATHTVVSGLSAVKVGHDVDLRILGPLGCGIQTGAGSVIHVLKPTAGESIAVFGTGSVGLAAIMAAKMLGCYPIIAIDVLPSRLDIAREFGATHTIDCRFATNIADQIMVVSGGLNTAFDSTGSIRLMDIAVKCFLPEGRGCGVAAAGRPSLSREDRDAGKTWDEIIQGCSIPRLFIPEMIDYYRKGLFPFDKMITFFEFDEINEALASSRTGKVIKPVLIMGHQM